MLALDRPYCSLADVQREVGNTDPDYYDQFSQAVNQASRAIDRLCNRDFWFHDHASTAFRVPAKNVVGELILLPFEIITLTEVLQDEGSAEDADSYDYNVGGKLITGTSGFTGRKVYVKGTFGFAIVDTVTPPATLHAEVRRAATLIASAWSHEWRKERVGFDGTRDSVLETQIPPEAMTLLKPFRLDPGAHFG